MAGRFAAEIVAKRGYGRCTELVMEADGFKAEPGQFVHVRCGDRGVILRRPYSVFNASGSSLSLLVREVGAGSAWLCATQVGSRLDLLGPLGRGFDLGGEGEHVIIAGGTGIAPMRFLARRLAEMGVRAAAFWGVESEEEYRGLPAVLEKEMDLRLATMDGSAGYHGSVVGLYREVGMDGVRNLYACGPRGMLAGLVECLTEDALGELQVCMEERMACGVGACRGCVAPAAYPAGAYLTVCRDGPVFRGRELDWERMRAWTWESSSRA